MALELVEDAFGDSRNAHALAVASELAYSAAESGTAGFKEQLGLDARLINVDNTQAWVATNADNIVVAFRGTEEPTTIEGLKDWLLTDAVNLLIVPEGRLGTDFIAAGVGARFHKGFMDALAEIWDPLFAAVKEELGKSERPLWLTGHSLGGALALLAAWLFDRKFVSVHQVYTFGAPMIGNDATAAAFDKAFPNKIHRYINSVDPVPLLPTISLVANGYRHCLNEVCVGEASGSQSALEMLKGLASKSVDGVIAGTLFSDIWSSVVARVAAHGLDNYRKLMNEHLK